MSLVHLEGSFTLITAWRVPARALAASLAVMVPVLATAATASGAIVINEIETEGTDFVELKNTGGAAVALGGYAIKDDDDTHVFTIPGGTSIAAGGYYSVETPFGLSDGDAARLFEPGNAVAIDSHSWTEHAGATYGRCPDGTGPIGQTNASTRDAANSCPLPAVAWPGGSAIAFADGDNVFGGNLSGLTYQPSGTSARGVLWAVRNGPSTLFRLVHDGTRWTPDTANGWGAGKQLLYTDGTGVPDAEGVTLAGGDANGVFVSTERNDTGADVSRPAILRFDVSSGAATLTATDDWNLTGDLPGLDDNAGLEAVTWVPDAVLVAKGFRDEATGAAYDPATYADHGAGLFFAGVEADGRIVAYALNQTSGAFTRVATIASGFPTIMALEFEPESGRLWAVCDNSCDGRSVTLDVAQAGADDGRFVVTAAYERPGGMPNLNNEGFAIAPQAECTGGRKPVVWADDGNVGGHALREGSLDCTDLPRGQSPPVVTVDPPPAPVGPPLPPPGPSPGPPAPSADTTAPGLKVALRSLRAVRRNGRLRAVVTLSERADLTVTATARNARSRARRVLRTTRTGVAPGRRTLTLTLARRARKSLRRGQTLTISVLARDAAGNAATRRAALKVP